MVRGAGIEPETAFDQAVKLALFDFGRFAVERDDVYQQRRRRQPVAGVVKGPTFVPGGRNDVGNELAKSVQHYFLDRLRSDNEYMAVKINLRNPCRFPACITI